MAGGKKDKAVAKTPDREAERAAERFELALGEFFELPGGSRTAGGTTDIHALHGEARDDLVSEYLSFRLNDELFAVSILFIKEIIKPPAFTEVPRTDPVILGVLSLRGTIVPVVDLRLLLRLDATPQTRKSRTLIVDTEDELIGLLVDEVRQVIRLKEEDIEPPPAVFGRSEVEHMVGVGRHEGEMFTLIDLPSVVELDMFIQYGAGGRIQ